MYKPKPGDRIRVTRRRPDGKTHFVKTGTVVDVDSSGYLFDEDGGGKRRRLAGCELVAECMTGWTQTIERASR